MKREEIVVIHVNKLDPNVVEEIGAEVVQRWKREGDVWLVVKGRRILSRHQAREEAERRVELFRLADQVVNDIREYVTRRLNELTEEQVCAIRDLLGCADMIIPIQRRQPGKVKEYEIDLFLFGKPAWELEGLEGGELDASFANKLEELGEALNARLKFCARVLRELLARGWIATGALYNIFFYKEATWEEVEADAKEVGLDPDMIREVEEWEEDEEYEENFEDKEEWNGAEE